MILKASRFKLSSTESSKGTILLFRSKISRVSALKSLSFTPSNAKNSRLGKRETEKSSVGSLQRSEIRRRQRKKIGFRIRNLGFLEKFEARTAIFRGFYNAPMDATGVAVLCQKERKKKNMAIKRRLSLACDTKRTNVPTANGTWQAGGTHGVKIET